VFTADTSKISLSKTETSNAKRNISSKDANSEGDMYVELYVPARQCARFLPQSPGVLDIDGGKDIQDKRQIPGHRVEVTVELGMAHTIASLSRRCVEIPKMKIV
jgi:hypothetical protein